MAKLKANKDKQPIDFKIEDNLEVIENNNWEDIWDEFKKTKKYQYCRAQHLYYEFNQWLKENYNAPIKK